MKKFDSKFKNKLFLVSGIIVMLASALAVAMLSPMIFGVGFVSAIIFTPSPLMGEMRKKGGSVVFSRNHYSNFIRKLVKPINPRSSAQTAVRTSLKSLSQSWKGLTQARILAWNQLATQISKKNRLGQLIHLTGEALYIECNMNILQAGGTVISDAPPISSNNLAGFDTPQFAITTGVITFEVDTALTSNQIVIFRSSGIVSNGKTFNSRFKTFDAETVGVTTPLTITTSWVATFGTAPVATNIVFFEARIVDKTTGFSTLYEKFRVVAG